MLEEGEFSNLTEILLGTDKDEGILLLYKLLSLNFNMRQLKNDLYIIIYCISAFIFINFMTRYQFRSIRI